MKIFLLVMVTTSFYIPVADAQTESEEEKNKIPYYHCQLGFGSALTFCKDDRGGASLMTDPGFKSETKELIPGFFLAYRFNRKLSLHISYEGFWKITRAGAYSGSYYDNGTSPGDWSGGILLGIFQGFGISIPPEAPHAAGWYPVTDEMSWETWGDVLSARIGYTFIENKYIRVSANTGPCLVLTTESVYIHPTKVYTINNSDQIIAQQSETFQNLSQGLDAYAGLQVELKLLHRFSFLIYSNGGLPIINPSSPEQSAELYTPQGNKYLTSGSHHIRSSFVNAGAGIVYNFVSAK
ncbi:MAG: hypothetical protein ABI772_04320 [Bacteroidota bacterium]